MWTLTYIELAYVFVFPCFLKRSIVLGRVLLTSNISHAGRSGTWMMQSTQQTVRRSCHLQVTELSESGIQSLLSAWPPFARLSLHLEQRRLWTPCICFPRTPSRCCMTSTWDSFSLQFVGELRIDIELRDFPSANMRYHANTGFSSIVRVSNVDHWAFPTFEHCIRYSHLRTLNGCVKIRNGCSGGCVQSIAVVVHYDDARTGDVLYLDMCMVIFVRFQLHFVTLSMATVKIWMLIKTQRLFSILKFIHAYRWWKALALESAKVVTLLLVGFPLMATGSTVWYAVDYFSWKAV